MRAAIIDSMPDRLDASLCAYLLADCYYLRSQTLQDACKRYAISNFGACSTTAGFKLWPAAVLLDILESDLRVVREEDVLSAVLDWHATEPKERGAATQLLLRQASAIG